MPVTFQNQEIAFRLKQKQLIRAWIGRVISLQKKKTGELNFVFTSDEALLHINQQFLNHNTYTDIITFDACEGIIINGDIIISIDRVKDNAEKYAVDLDQELRRVIIHGVLHLCGYKDKSKADAKQMRAKENWALQLFVPGLTRRSF